MSTSPPPLAMASLKYKPDSNPAAEPSNPNNVGSNTIVAAPASQSSRSSSKSTSPLPLVTNPAVEPYSSSHNFEGSTAAAIVAGIASIAVAVAASYNREKGKRKQKISNKPSITRSSSSDSIKIYGSKGKFDYIEKSNNIQEAEVLSAINAVDSASNSDLLFGSDSDSSSSSSSGEFEDKDDNGHKATGTAAVPIPGVFSGPNQSEDSLAFGRSVISNNSSHISDSSMYSTGIGPGVGNRFNFWAARNRSGRRKARNIPLRHSIGGINSTFGIGDSSDESKPVSKGTSQQNSYASGLRQKFIQEEDNDGHDYNSHRESNYESPAIVKTAFESAAAYIANDHQRYEGGQAHLAAKAKARHRQYEPEQGRLASEAEAHRQYDIEHAQLIFEQIDRSAEEGEQELSHEHRVIEEAQPRKRDIDNQEASVITAITPATVTATATATATTTTTATATATAATTADSTAPHQDLDDAKTIYSDASSVATLVKEHYISELADALFHEIRTDQPDSKTLERISIALPELLKAFALKVGYNASSQMHRDIMFFVHKYRGDVAEYFMERCTREEVESLPDDQTTDPNNMSWDEKMNFWYERSEHPPLSHQGPFVEDKRSPHGESHEADIDVVMLHQPQSVEEGTVGEIIQDKAESEEDEDAKHAHIIQPLVYKDFISKAPAFEWLVGSLRREVILTPTEPNYMGAIKNMIIKSLPQSCRVSKNKSAEAFRVNFMTGWKPLAFVSEQGYRNGPDEAIERAITLTGSAEDAQALTCAQYLCQTWPTGKHIIGLIKDVVHSGARTPCRCMFPSYE
ncbi:hypothetical protein ABW20_dc0101051 [Dactylellina cionopaga]|nr:hypothetical protein ABW20_dc0101051 [Dactylellina cionopaga]